MNRDNLLTLAIYLESLPKYYMAFNMYEFLETPTEEKTEDYLLRNGDIHECGAVACAIGHGPSAGFLFPPAPENGEDHNDFWYKVSEGDGVSYYRPDWMNYSAEFFISDQEHFPEWEWCFSGNWGRTDNHHWGAAARIRYLLAGNNPPQVTDSEGHYIPFEASFSKDYHVELYSSFRKVSPETKTKESTS